MKDRELNTYVDIIEALYDLNKITIYERNKAISSINYVDEIIDMYKLTDEEIKRIIKVPEIKAKMVIRQDAGGCLIVILAGISILCSGLMVII